MTRLPARLLRRFARPARRQARAAGAARGEPAPGTAAAWMRAARVLEVRSRRLASGGFAGAYRSAFRGGGLEFEETRPYLPGDDVRAIEWNLLARTGELFVKRFREERGRPVLVALDLSASMDFGSAGRSAAAAAAHAGALVAAAAARSGDRVGLITFDTAVREEIAPARGDAHATGVVRALAASPRRAAGATDLAAALSRVAERLRAEGGRGLLILLSDFRDEAFFAGAAGGRPPGLISLARHHEVVAVLLEDLRDETLPAAGSVWVADPERPERPRLLRSGRAAVRERFRAAARARRRERTRRLRAAGAEVLVLRSDADPLRMWMRFLSARAGRRVRRRASA